MRRPSKSCAQLRIPVRELRKPITAQHVVVRVVLHARYDARAAAAATHLHVVCDGPHEDDDPGQEEGGPEVEQAGAVQADSALGRLREGSTPRHVLQREA